LSESPVSESPSTTRSESDEADGTIPPACGPEIPHDAPDLEALLPTVVAGRTLSKESYHGRLLTLCVQGGTQSDVDELAALLAEEDLGLDDMSQATAGRSDTKTDPPYFVLAYRLTGHPGSEWPPRTGLDYPDLAAFQNATIAGKDVLVGDAAAIEQTAHALGQPYVWDSLTVHYLIVTDDPSWAEEVLRSLQ
jgi:hypothetical protein